MSSTGWVGLYSDAECFVIKFYMEASMNVQIWENSEFGNHVDSSGVGVFSRISSPAIKPTGNQKISHAKDGLYKR